MTGLTPVLVPTEVRLSSPQRRCESTDSIAARVLSEEHELRLHREGSRPYCPRCYPGGPAARELARRERSQPRLRNRQVGSGRTSWLREVRVTWHIDMPRRRYAKSTPEWAALLRTRPGETARVEVLPSKDAAAHRAMLLRRVLQGYDVGTRGVEVFARWRGEER